MQTPDEVTKQIICFRWKLKKKLMIRYFEYRIMRGSFALL